MFQSHVAVSGEHSLVYRHDADRLSPRTVQTEYVNEKISNAWNLFASNTYIIYRPVAILGNFVLELLMSSKVIDRCEFVLILSLFHPICPYFI